MILSRRQFVATGALASLAAGVTINGLMKPSASLVVYDGRIPESRAFANSHSAFSIDVADEHMQRWRSFRSSAVDGRWVGLTRWSEFILVRGFAAEQRKHVSSHEFVGRLIAWEIS